VGTENFDVKAAKDKAKAEITKERIEEATKKLKAKLQEIAATEVILNNLNRELEALEDELSHGL